MSSVNKRALSSEDLLQTALNLMERLTTASSASVDAASFARDASISLEQTNEVVELLQGVADERSGSHIALDYQDGAITLSGDDGSLPASSHSLVRAVCSGHRVGSSAWSSKTWSMAQTISSAS